jgi:hypothetical protein
MRKYYFKTTALSKKYKFAIVMFREKTKRPGGINEYNNGFNLVCSQGVSFGQRENG